MTITDTSIEFSFPALKEVQGEIDAKQKSLADVFAEAGPDVNLTKVKSVTGGKDAVLGFIRQANVELADLGVKRDDLMQVAIAAKAAAGWDPARTEPGTGEPKAETPRSLGAAFIKAGGHKARNAAARLDMPLKTLFERSTGWDPEATRSGLVVLDEQRPVQVTDLLPQIPGKSDAYKYMEETTFTNNAAEKAEGATYGEAALALTERSATIEKVTVWLPVTDEQLEDEVGAMAYIDARLPFMIRQRVDSQILVGNGTTPNILGVNNKTGISTQAKGTDPTPDAVHKGITKVRVTGRAVPNAVVFHDNDWQDIRLLRTNEGVYIWGNPSDEGPERIWGLRVVRCDAQTENTAVVGDFANYSLLVVRRGLDVQVSNSHSTFFVEGKQAIRADIRLATVWTRATAFCTVTGI